MDRELAEAISDLFTTAKRTAERHEAEVRRLRNENSALRAENKMLRGDRAALYTHIGGVPEEVTT